MSNLSELLPTGGGQNTANFVASGTLSSGQVVVLRSDGKVEAVGPSPASYGAENNFWSTDPFYIAATYNEDQQRLVIAFNDWSGNKYGFVVVGTVSGTSISFGTPIVFYSNPVTNVSIGSSTVDNRILIMWTDGTYQYGIGGLVSSSSITLGSASSSSSSVRAPYGNAIVFGELQDEFLIIFTNTLNYYGQQRQVTVNKTNGNISWGSEYTWNTSFPYAYNFKSLGSGYYIAAYRQSSGHGYASVLYITPASTSYGTSTYFDSNVTGSPTPYGVAVAHDTINNKVVLAWRNNSNGYGYSVVGTVTGTSISFGTIVAFYSSSQFNPSAIFDAQRGKIVISFADATNGYLKTIEGEVSGTNISFGTAITGTQYVSNYPITYDTSTNQTIIPYAASGGQAVVYTGPSSTKDSAIGLTASAIASGASGSVNLKGGLNEAQTGLTIGADYYAQDDGTLSTTVTSSKIGQAISATTINMMDLT